RNRDRRDAGDELIELRAATEDEGVLEVDVHQHVGADRHDAGERMQSTEDEGQAVLIDRRHAARHRRVDRHAVSLRAGSRGHQSIWFAPSISAAVDAASLHQRGCQLGFAPPAMTLSIACTSSSTWLTETRNCFCSSSVRAISITFSTPPAPICTGTPTYTPRTPYSPSRYAAHGRMRR